MSKESEIKEAIEEFERDYLEASNVPKINKRCFSKDSEANKPIIENRLRVGRIFKDKMEEIEKKYKHETIYQWISVNDRLPEDVEMCIVYRPTAHLKPHYDPNITIKKYCESRKEFRLSSVQPTHWMSLPNPPLEK